MIVSGSKGFETQTTVLQSSGFNLTLGPQTALEIERRYFEQDKLPDNVAITFSMTSVKGGC